MSHQSLKWLSTVTEGENQSILPVIGTAKAAWLSQE